MTFVLNKLILLPHTLILHHFSNNFPILPIAIGPFLANFALRWWKPADIFSYLFSTNPTHFRAIKPSKSIQIFGQHATWTAKTVAVRKCCNTHTKFAFTFCGEYIFQLDTWNSIWEWHGQHKMQHSNSREHNNTIRQCGAELLGSVGSWQLCFWGSALFSFAACAMQIQVNQMLYKYVENGLPNQAEQPQMHQLSNCLPRQRRHNVHQIIAEAVTRQATGQRTWTRSLSALGSRLWLVSSMLAGHPWDR